MSRTTAHRSTASGTAVAALQAALGAVHAAIYGYGIAGAYLAGAAQQAAHQDWTVHQAARDRLAAMLISLGAEPAAAQDAYRLPFPVHDATAAASLAGYLEDRLTAAYLGLVAVDGAALRAWGARQAQACAVRATSWLGRTVAFPGFPAQQRPARPR